jgi:hypothetical protein
METTTNGNHDHAREGLRTIQATQQHILAKK